MTKTKKQFIKVTYSISKQAFDQIQSALGYTPTRTKEIISDRISTKGLREDSVFVVCTGNSSASWDIAHTDKQIYEITDIYRNNNRIIRLRNGEVKTVRYVGRLNRRTFCDVMPGDDAVIKEESEKETFTDPGTSCPECDEAVATTCEICPNCKTNLTSTNKSEGDQAEQT